MKSQKALSTKKRSVTWDATSSTFLLIPSPLMGWIHKMCLARGCIMVRKALESSRSAFLAVFTRVRH